MDIGVPEFYENKNVLITGGTGFIGKVLVEKLLRSCPSVNKIYLITRKSRHDDMAERWRKIWEMPLFDIVRREHPDRFNKIVPVAGDLSQLGLALSHEDTEFMIKNVDVLIHGAATVRFDQPLYGAVIMNTRGTRELCRLALEMKKLQIFVHVSTAYAHTPHAVIREHIYPPYADWKKTIEIAECMDTETLKAVSHFYMSGFPNTYAFTKSMSENVVHDMLNNKIPNIIMRPTIVVPTVTEPFRGWVDNFNGPVGLLMALSTGLIKVCLIGPNQKCDYVFADCFVKVLLTATWHQAVKVRMNKETYVMNVGSSGIIEVDTLMIKKICDELVWRIPHENVMWIPKVTLTTSKTLFQTYFFFLQLLPAVVLDSLLKLIKAKPKVVRLQRQYYNISQVVEYYLLNDWLIENVKLSLLQDELLPKDKKTFSHSMNDIVPMDDLPDIFCGGKIYLLKESIAEEKLRPIIRRLKMFWILDKALQIPVYIGCFYLAKWILYKCSDIITTYWCSL